METNVNTTLNSREMSMLDILWNLYNLQDERVKSAFWMRAKNEVPKNLYVTDYPDITTTEHYRQAMEDVDKGRVSSYASLKDFYNEMGL